MLEHGTCELRGGKGKLESISRQMGQRNTYPHNGLSLGFRREILMCATPQRKLEDEDVILGEAVARDKYCRHSLAQLQESKSEKRRAELGRERWALLFRSPGDWSHNIVCTPASFI